MISICSRKCRDSFAFPNIFVLGNSPCSVLFNFISVILEIFFTSVVSLQIPFAQVAISVQFTGINYPAGDEINYSELYSRGDQVVIIQILVGFTDLMFIQRG